MRANCGKFLVALLGGVLVGVAGARAQTPASITISPVDPQLHVGQTLQFAANSDVTLNFGQGGAIAAGDGHTCALVSDGTVRCWGINSYGQLGDGTTTYHFDPRPVSGISGATAVVTGAYHTCALLADGTVRCWGANDRGQLGNGITGNSSTPVTVSGLGGVKAIAAGQNHTCAVVSGGAVKCWGSNGFGQLGDGTTTNSRVPVSASGLAGAIAVAAGQSHSCALLVDGTVECWGYNNHYQLGNGTTTNSTTPTGVSGLSGETPDARATAIYTSQSSGQSCALISDGSVKCWGYGSFGALGNGTDNDAPTPTLATGLSGASVIAIVTGRWYSCALLSGGTAKCWGYNNYGQLGNGSTATSFAPVSVSGLSEAKSITAGSDHTCALLSDGTARCWGDNFYGMLGDGTSVNRNAPVAVVGTVLPGAGAGQIAAGGAHSCALLGDGTVKCWGHNSYGQLGNASTTDSYTPVSVTGLSNAKQIGLGSSSTFALLGDGTVMSWGTNVMGQLGTGTTSESAQSTPVAVAGVAGVASIAAGQSHTCALLTEGTVKCWGWNEYGQLGDGSTSNRASPVTVTGLAGVRAIAAGAMHTCAVLADGTVRCWGYNLYGALGNGTSGDTPQTSPVTVSGLNGAIALAAGYFHTCALLSDGTAKCWGVNSDGELGSGSPGNSNTPVAVSGLSGAWTIAAGSGNHTCALLSDGTAKCWGYNYFGELGNGTYDNQATPVLVSGLSGAIALGAGYVHTCALLSGGTAKCWGINGYGSVGDGTSGNSRTTPTAVSPFVTNVTWTSDMTSAATIHAATGFATAVGLGTATITANYGELSDTTTLTVVSANSAPTATSVSISGTPNVGSQLTGSYTYNDADADLEGTSTFRWLRDGTAIGGATSSTYTPVAADAGHSITFEVTSVALTGTSPGVAVASAAVTINSAPTATSVSITGIPIVGATLTGHYTYGDVNGDSEGTSTFRWLSDGTAISGATGINYTMASGDLGHALTFEVTPVAQTGTSPGAAVTSSGVTIASLESIGVTPANPTIAAGATQQFTATGAYSGGSGDVTNLVTWTSLKTRSVTIATDGLATAVKSGTSTIVAAYGTVRGSTNVTVAGAALTSIAVTPTDSTVAVGKSVQFTATGTYSDGSTRNITTAVTWTSRDPSVATISSTGVAIGVAAGDSIITATLGSIDDAQTLTVQKALVSLSISPMNPSISVAHTVQLTATGTFSDSSTENVTNLVAWSSSKPSVATVDSTGLVTGHSAGRASIKTKLGGVAASTTVVVTPVR